VNRPVLWPYFYRPSFLSVLRTVYSHRLYAHGKTSSGFAKIIRVSSVNLKTAFTCYRKQRILVHHGKGYKVARRYSSDLKLLRTLTFSERGLGRLVLNCFAQSVLTTSSLTCLEEPRSLENCYANSKTASLTFFTLRVYCVLCKRSVVHSVPFFCMFHFVSGWRDRCVSFP